MIMYTLTVLNSIANCSSVRHISLSEAAEADIRAKAANLETYKEEVRDASAPDALESRRQCDTTPADCSGGVPGRRRPAEPLAPPTTPHGGARELRDPGLRRRHCPTGANDARAA